MPKISWMVAPLLVAGALLFAVGSLLDADPQLWQRLDIQSLLEGVNLPTAILIFILILLCIAFGGVSERLYRKLLLPLRSLTEVASKIRDRDFSEPVSQDVIDRQDELGELGRAIEQMRGELKFMYYAVSESRAHDKALLDSLADGVLFVNLQGRIVYLNQAAAQQLRVDRAEVLGDKLSDIVEVKSIEGAPVALADNPHHAAQLSNNFIDKLFRYDLRDGGSFIAGVKVRPLVVAGKIEGSVEVFRDMTQLHETDKIKSDFISLASHQLRTPISAVNLYSEMLVNGEGGKLSREQLRHATLILEGGHTLAELIDALLRVAEIESGQVRLDKKPLNLSRLVEEIVDNNRHLADEYKAKVRLKAGANIQAVVDEQIVRQILDNLLSNAVKYSQGKVLVSLTRVGRKAHLVVADNGLGIPPEFQKHMFQKFMRAAQVNGPKRTGTGLGLYIAKMLTGLHGGEISYRTKKARGTQFDVTIPIDDGKVKKNHK